MTRTEIMNKLIDIFKLVVNSGVDTSKVSEDSNLTLDLGINSVGMIYLAIAMEKTFNVSLVKVTTNTFTTVKDVIDFIQKETE